MRSSLIPVRRVVVPVLAAAVVACGGDSTGPAGGDGPMSARIDGESWVAGALAVSAQTIAGVPGAFAVSGTSVFRTMSFSLYNIGGPGTYALGVGATMFGGVAIFADAGAGYSTDLSGMAGSITITALTDTRIAGSFEFVASLTSGNGPQEINVTNGVFDLPLNSGSGLQTVPDYAGSDMRGTLGGQPWVGAALASTYVEQTGTLVFSANNTEYEVTMALTGVSAPGDYPLSNTVPLRTAEVEEGFIITDGSNCCWSSSLAGATGSVTITSFTATRVAGTYSFTLPAEPGTSAMGPIVVTGGSFDLGLPPGS